MSKAISDLYHLWDNSAEANSAHGKMMVFFFRVFFFSLPRKQALAFHANCLLTETVCIKCQSLFSEKSEENISKCFLLIFFTQLAKR